MQNVYKPKKKFSFPKFSFRKKSDSNKDLGEEKKRKFKIKWGLIFKILLGIFIIFALILAFAWFYWGRPAYAVYKSGIDLKVKAGDLQDSLQTQDLGKIEEGLRAFNEDYEGFKVVYAENAPRLKSLPFAADYFTDVEYMLSAADSGIELGFLVIDTLDPYAAELGLKEGSTRLNNEQRITQVAQVLPKFSDQVDEISALMVQIDEDLSKIDSTKYPEEFRGVLVRGQIESIQTVFSQLAEKSPKFTGMFNELPTLLGVGEPITYLVLMANSTEIRMGGGFTTYAVVVEFKDGVPTIVKSVDTYNIDVDNFALVQPITAETSFMQQFLRVNRIYARDALSLSPDFIVGADYFLTRYWDRHPGGGRVGALPPVDGVISVNTHLAEDLLEVLGPVDVAGRAFLTDSGTYKGFNDTEFNSENVIYNLEMIANAELSEVAGRKDIIQFLMESMLDKTLNAKTENLAALASTFLEALGSKDLMVYVSDEQAQDAIEELGYSGRVVVPDSNSQDYLLVAHSNFGAGKRDWIVTRNTTKEVYEKNGKKISKVEIMVENPKTPDWWQDSWLYTYKDYLRLYVPKGTSLVSATASDGQDLQALIKQGGDQFNPFELDYIESFFTIEPGNNITVVYEYELPDTVDLNNYKLVLQKQSGTHGDIYTIKKGDQEKKFTLNEDTVLEFN